MRVLMLADVFFPDTIGGAGRCVYDLARFLIASGHEIQVVTRNTNDSLPETEVVDSIRIRRFSWRKEKPWRSYRYARSMITDILQSDSVDVIHGFQPLICSSVARRLRQHPCVYTYYSPWAEEYLIKSRAKDFFRRLVAARMRAIERRVLCSARKIVVLSGFAERLLRRDHPRTPQIHVVPAGVDLDRFRPTDAAERAYVRRKWDIDENAKLLLTVRNLVPRMGLKYLLKALALLRDKGTRFVQLIGGDGPLRSELEQLSRSLGLQHHAIFVGRIQEEEMAAYYSASDLFVLPTVELECFGLVVIESLACETPVLSTRCGGPEEILGPLGSSFLCARYDPRAMAEGIQSLLKEPFPRDGRLRNYVQRHFNWSSIAGRTEQIYAEALTIGLTERKPDGRRV
ncbi:MAG TPA: glycosyltransferase family 4 protein [Acidobacteriota bacterium]|jgi:glycosyltransferase involved in cell wall biosynthesis